MNTHRITVILGLFISSIVWAVSSNVPHGLFFLAKPVDPLCFSNLNSRSKVIDLKNCGLAKEKLVISGENSYLINQGFIGFDWQDPKASYPSQGESYYKGFNAGGNHYWIYTVNNSGGSGDFTAINAVKVKKAGLLEVSNLMSGDRCNGGIQDVKERNHHLFFSVNITAYDFLTLANDNPHHLKAYDDLETCAACCAAKAFYEVDSALKPQLNGVDLGAYAIDPAEMASHSRYQACFNTLLASHVKQGESRLNVAKLRQLVQEFNKTCVEGSLPEPQKQ